MWRVMERYCRVWWTPLVCELWMQSSGKMLNISLIIFGPRDDEWYEMWRGPVCSIFPPLFNLIRSEFKAEWVSKILPWSRFQIVFWRAVMMQVRAGRPGWVCTLLLLQRESPKYQLTHIQETVALNWMRHWACNIGMCLSEVDWEETREVSPQCC